MNRGAYILLCSLALVAGWTTAKLVKRLPPVPPRGDPRRYLWAQVLLYVGTFGLIAATVVVRLWRTMAIR
jgi:hypothetical protein